MQTQPPLPSTLTTPLPPHSPHAPIISRLISLCSCVAVYLLPLLLYAAIAPAIAFRHREHIRPDAIAYIRRALYLAHGDFYHSISGYWSPLLSWSIVPLLHLGVDPLYAAYTALCIWGAIFILAFALFLNSLTPSHRIWKLLALLVIAQIMSVAATATITPDVILAACLFAYFATLLNPHLLQRPRLQLLAGLLAGLAYLAKSYAFPFVLLHLPLTLLIRARALSHPTPEQQTPFPSRSLFKLAARPIAIALLGFFLIAAPWVAALSFRHRHLTFSTSASRSHAVVAPFSHPMPHFHIPADPYIIAWENPELLPYQFWSPFDSREKFARQLTVIAEHIPEVAQLFTRFDALRLSFLALALAPLAAAGLLQKNHRHLPLWFLLTILLYCAGYLPVFLTGRYLWSVILPLTLALALTLILHARFPSRPLARIIQSALALLVLISFSIAAAREIRAQLQTSSSRLYRTTARDIQRLRLHGPVASSDGMKGVMLAFFIDQKMAGFPLEQDPEKAERILRDHNIGMLLVWANPRVKAQDTYDRALAQIARPTWKCIYARRGDSLAIYVPSWSEAYSRLPEHLKQ